MSSHMHRKRVKKDSNVSGKSVSEKLLDVVSYDDKGKIELIPDGTKNQTANLQSLQEQGDPTKDSKSNIAEESETKVVYDFVRKKTFELNEWGVILGASLRGKSHVESDTECQDYHLFEDLGNGWQLFIVSDGAGSAKFAERGSKGNCTVACQLFKGMIYANKWVEEQSMPTELQWYIECRSIFEKMKLVYRNKANESDGLEETDFNATIILCVVTPNGLMTAHIGDGRMGFLSQNGEWKSLMVPHKGEEANQTIFLQNAWTFPRVPALKISGVFVPEVRILYEIPQAIVLMSDGFERSAWECSIYNESKGRYEDINLPHPAFMNPLIESIVGEKEENRIKLLIDIMDKGTKSCEQERDDKTMLIGINKEMYELSNIS